ncbi:Glycosyl transferase [Sphingomonas sp. EC-HK361]|uniref:glycosyltransferase family 4 protein n=1 Tax=Sphingomonas sp. EC-HK361 TaxID=2038397 RepID=UPI0012584E5C|nr:glycosyltransferase family 4 protein [Sphingomonas sp. EC-HK361]VVT22523.1 Glycosyl transferase [Sphingomonas sp. EC-HK361]
MKIVILSSLSMSLINFRGALIARMATEGHDVVACAPDAEPEVVAALARMGVRFSLTPMARAGTNPVRDLATLWTYLRLIRRERADMVVAYTQKPIIYGGLAARIATRLGRPVRFHAIMSGLGYVFSSEADSRGLLRRAVSWLYRQGVRRAERIFVFNGDDRADMIAYRIVDADQPVVQVPGSGVDTRHYAEQPMPGTPTTFLMMGRLMRDKGVGDYVAAARSIRARWPDTRFLLLGRPETENPTGYSAEEIAGWQADGLITLLPETRDVRPHIATAHIFVLPSFYREGLPRTILEALSMGRPVVTTDMPGCREPIREGENGFLVPPKDAAALAEAMARFIDQPALVTRMGAAARETAIAIYDVERVNRQLLGEMGLLDQAQEAAPPPATAPALVSRAA